MFIKMFMLLIVITGDNSYVGSALEKLGPYRDVYSCQQALDQIQRHMSKEIRGDCVAFDYPSQETSANDIRIQEQRLNNKTQSRRIYSGPDFEWPK